MEQKTFTQYFDHTILKPDATLTDIKKLCEEAAEYHFLSVCVNPFWIPVCRKELAHTKVKTCTVVGFPLGANSTITKVEETEDALEMGAHEIDCVINVGALKSGLVTAVVEELQQIVDICQGSALVKVIVESGILQDNELITAIDCVNRSGAKFIKTSTGFAAAGASTNAVALMKKHGRQGLKIKASGGIRTLADVQTYINLGVHRVGASRSVDIFNEWRKTNG